MNVATLFWQACDRHAERLAVVDGERSFSYAQLHARVAGLTRFLQDQGLTAGDRVAIVSRNSSEYLETIWACVSIGAVPVPINFRLADRELQSVLAFADARLFFASSEFAARLRRCLTPDQAGAAPLIVWPGARAEQAAPESAPAYEDVLATRTDARPPMHPVPGDAPCLLIFTGGTSGTPKAVPRSHRNLLATLLLQPGIALTGNAKTVLAATPFFHVAGQIAAFVLAQGGTVVVGDGAFSGRHFLELVQRYRIEAAFVVPAMISQIANAETDGAADVSCLRELRSGGAPLPTELANKLIHRFSGIRLWNGGGSTEAGTIAAGSWEELSPRGFGCIGRPPIGQEVRVFSDEGELLPAGETGELRVRGAQVAPGYWRDASRSEESFRDGWCSTADIGRIDEDGFVYLIDRKSDMIISGGENIYAREVEEALHRASRVREAAV
ncbi:MAG: class I adenylate-forming enzyme family protein, partial [Pseudorhodoplanes sp.]